MRGSFDSVTQPSTSDQSSSTKKSKEIGATDSTANQHYYLLKDATAGRLNAKQSSVPVKSITKNVRKNVIPVRHAIIASFQQSD